MKDRHLFVTFAPTRTIYTLKDNEAGGSSSGSQPVKNLKWTGRMEEHYANLAYWIQMLQPTSIEIRFDIS